MAVHKYTENGREYFKVYVHVRSQFDRKMRIQKYSYLHKTEAEARREERKLLQEAAREMQKVDGLGLNWADVIHLWWQDMKLGHYRKISDRSAEGYLSILNKWTKHWQNRPAAELSRADGRELILRMEKFGVSRTYQKKVKNIINNVFEWGVEFKHIQGASESPMRGLLIQKGEEKAPDILTLEEIKKFLTAAKALEHRWYPVWSFAILTGMRSGELYALTWDQIDLEKGTILVDRSFDSNSKSLGPTKGRYWRTVPINAHLQKLIIELKGKTDRDFPEFVLPRIKDWENGDQAVPLRNFLKSLKIKDIKFHALRACWATQMLANGVPAPVAPDFFCLSHFLMKYLI